MTTNGRGQNVRTGVIVNTMRRGNMEGLTRHRARTTGAGQKTFRVVQPFIDTCRTGMCGRRNRVQGVHSIARLGD